MKNFTRTESRYTWFLHYEGSKVHALDGSQGEDILRHQAQQWNEECYEPKMVKGKIYLELTHPQKLKLAYHCSPLLPFGEEGAV